MRDVGEWGRRAKKKTESKVEIEVSVRERISLLFSKLKPRLQGLGRI